MKFVKLFFSIALALSISLSATASTVSGNNKSTTEKTTNEIKKTINKMNLSFDLVKQTEIKLKFMVNESNELIVLSTGDSKLDGHLKSALNYKVLKSSDLTPYKVYILPIKFAKK